MRPKRENKSAEILLKDMAHDSQIRTTERSKHLMEDYEAELEDIEDKADKTAAKNDKVLSAIREEQLTRLLTLVHKRTAIETAIAESHTRLNQAYETASSKLRRSTKNHVDSIENAVAAASPNAPASEDGSESRENKENDVPLVLAAKTNAGKPLKRRSSGIRTEGQDRREGSIQK